MAFQDSVRGKVLKKEKKVKNSKKKVHEVFSILDRTKGVGVVRLRLRGRAVKRKRNKIEAKNQNR